MLTLIRCPFHPRVTVVARKRPRYSTKTADGRLHVHRHIPLTQQSRSGLTMPQSGHSVGTYPETSSHATCWGTFGHSRLSLLSHCGLVWHKKKKGRRGMNGRTFSQNPRKRGKRHQYLHQAKRLRQLQQFQRHG